MLLYFLLFFIFSAGISAEECHDEHAHWVDCAPPCAPTCGDPDPITCEAPCVGSCVCDEGYLMNSLQQCIPESECRTCTRKHEEYKNCGQNCPRCSHLDVNCAEVCMKGCYCEMGYVRNSQDECVEVTKCKECGNNEDYLIEPDKCEAVCRNVKKKRCEPKDGCFCLDGHLRNATGSCVDRKECRKGDRAKHEHCKHHREMEMEMAEHTSNPDE